jgi:hypothetical protein
MSHSQMHMKKFICAAFMPLGVYKYIYIYIQRGTRASNENERLAAALLLLPQPFTVNWRGMSAERAFVNNLLLL